ncbi:hypothetical protein TorRG33x02_192230 [Trema orientale]|uniref:Uncharacterized protein n=1 Tax=Trema orientale TaxID=63057 RepID=A0A2P5EHF5_TREOI|nr:hypothetical protein TorRG33x02_192230 [Trema orientale]
MAPPPSSPSQDFLPIPGPGPGESPVGTRRGIPSGVSAGRGIPARFSSLTLNLSRCSSFVHRPKFDGCASTLGSSPAVLTPNPLRFLQVQSFPDSPISLTARTISNRIQVKHP